MSVLRSLFLNEAVADHGAAAPSGGGEPAPAEAPAGAARAIVASPMRTSRVPARTSNSSVTSISYVPSPATGPVTFSGAPDMFVGPRGA